MAITTEELHIGNQPDTEQVLHCPCGDSYLRHRSVKVIPNGLAIAFSCETSGCQPELILRRHKGEMFVQWRGQR